MTNIPHMITIHVRELAEKRGFKNAHQLQLAAGFAPHVATRLWKGKAERISLDTIDRLCRALECQPGKIFKYVPESG
jgi:DNA-binding Xre family transcriptional regulator